MVTKRKKTSPDFESLQREIARRLKAKLPLAGMIAATTLLTGCHEHSENFPAGSVPRDPSLYEQTEKPKPKTPAPAKRNDRGEQQSFRTTGMVAPVESNRRNETENDVPAGDVEPPPSNWKNETHDPASVRGRYPSMKRDK